MIRNILLALSLMLFVPNSFAAHGGEVSVVIEEIEQGSGLEASRYSIVDVHYTGKLEDGTVFDSSKDRGAPIQFTLGAGQVIPGWDQGIEGMKPGSRRVLKIPPELAYGKKGAGNTIPPNATLIFDVELVAVKPPPFNSISNTELESKIQSGIKIIDIRRLDEWRQTGIVEGSIQSTAFDNQGRFLQSFMQMLEKTVKPDEEFALICRTGNRTAVLSNWLATEGNYKNVLNVKDGITSWIKEERPIVKSGS
jgi:rhodanese-related sulfurtransferase